MIDPYQSATARKADWHIRPLPGTDTALALGLMREIISSGLTDDDYIRRYTTGIEELKQHVSSCTLDWTSAITGLDGEDIARLAREYSAAENSTIRVLIGLEHHVNGANAFRSVAILPSLTGAWRKRGGGLLHMTYEAFGEALNWEALDFYNSISKKDIRTINMIQLGRTLNDATLSPPVKSLFVFNCNPAVITPDQNAVIRGLEREDLFTVVLEHFITDTARYADIVLPATTQLEHWDLMDSWGQLYLNLNEPAMEPLGESKSNSEIFRMIAHSLGFEEDYLFTPDIDLIHATLDSDHPYLEGTSFDSLRETGWARLKLPEEWIPHEKGRFKTPSGKCEFYSAKAVEDGLDPMPRYIPPTHENDDLYPLHLMTLKKSRSFLNTSHANVDRLLQVEGRPKLDIHIMDARKRGINHGDEVRIFNEKGEMYLVADVNDTVSEGVVCAPQGYWSSLVKGGSTANALTNDGLTDIGGGGALQNAWVNIEKTT